MKHHLDLFQRYTIPFHLCFSQDVLTSTWATRSLWVQLGVAQTHIETVPERRRVAGFREQHPKSMVEPRTYVQEVAM